MRHFIIAVCLLFCGFFAQAQDTVSRENQLGFNIYESFYVLKANKKVRHGLYIAVYKKATVLAKGEYNNGKRAGQWQFFDATGKPTQIYNYDTGEFSMIDQVSKRGIACSFAETPTATDVISRPVAIGGAIYAVTPLIARMDIDEKVRPSGLKDGDPPLELTHVLNIDSTGMVTKHTVTITVEGNARTYTINDSDYNDGSPRFTPAKVNGKALPCEVKFKSTFSVGRPTTINTKQNRYFN